MKVAIIDLGTNTFNLLIAEKIPDGFTIIYNQKIPVKLGEKRINHGEIIPEAYERGINAIHKHEQTIKSFNVDVVKAFGTSALRSADNGQSFIDDIKQQLGIEIEIITGDREAELIYKGVRQTIDFTDKPSMILDIGGGSNEFIIANKDEVLWKKSYPLGIARLLAKFKPSDPISSNEIETMNQFLREELKDLFIETKRYSIDKLIGASGSFETIEAMIMEIDSDSESSKQPSHFHIQRMDFDKLYQRLIKSTLEERKVMKGLEPMRREMIVLAMIFIKYVLDSAEIKQLYQSSFALKEGAVSELMS
ncbi:MAG: hypothetical protein MI922_07350 [Bacteroidales bacterium]|nr:hypothetical protein [Bacteroidales bacterium]